MLKRKKASKNKVQDVNGFVMAVVYHAVRLYFRLCGVRIKAVNKVGRPKYADMCKQNVTGPD